MGRLAIGLFGPSVVGSGGASKKKPPQFALLSDGVDWVIDNSGTVFPTARFIVDTDGDFAVDNSTTVGGLDYGIDSDGDPYVVT